METEKLANFYLEIMDLENELKTLEWKVDLDSQQISQWSMGEPLLSIAPLDVDLQTLFKRFYAVAQACLKWQVGPQPISHDLLTALEQLDASQKKIFINDLLRIDGQMAKWARDLNIHIDLLDFIACNTFKPLLKSFGQMALKQVDIKDWMQGHCPVCGDQPTMAKLTGKEGARKLYCGRCETEWNYKRMGCPYCKDANASEASFLTLEEFKQYRVYLCDHCKSYLKTVDERVCGDVDLFCEDLATVELDNIAQSEGYQRGDKRQHA